MPRFVYRKIKNLDPRPGTNYATAFYQQTPAQREHLQLWLEQVARDIGQVCLQDPAVDTWFISGLKKFRTTERGKFYTPEQLLFGMRDRLAQQEDVSVAMVDRWNRLCDVEIRDWQIEMTDQARPTPDYARLFV